MTIDAYLFFDGNCEEVMNFYASTLNGEILSMNRFAEGPMDVPEEAKNRVMHGTLQISDTVLMFSDTMPGEAVSPGNNFSLSVNCESPEQQDKVYQALAEGGKEIMPIEDTFWGARFGMCVDRFGTSWMLNYHAEPEKS